MPTTSIHVERTCMCPFSIAGEYAVQYLKRIGSGGQQSPVRLPLSILYPTLGRKANMSFELGIDRAESGRLHDEIRLCRKGGSTVFPSFRGTIRFRIDGTRTRVLIDESYEPPLGGLGILFDRAIGQRIAVRMLGDLAGRLSSDLERQEREWRAARQVTEK